MRTGECVMRFSAYQGWWWLQLELVIPTITRSHSNLYPNQLALWPNPELIPNPNSNHNLTSLVRVEYELSWVRRLNDYSLHARHLWSVYTDYWNIDEGRRHSVSGCKQQQHRSWKHYTARCRQRRQLHNASCKRADTKSPCCLQRHCSWTGHVTAGPLDNDSADCRCPVAAHRLIVCHLTSRSQHHLRRCCSHFIRSVPCSVIKL